MKGRQRHPPSAAEKLGEKAAAFGMCDWQWLKRHFWLGSALAVWQLGWPGLPLFICLFAGKSDLQRKTV